MIKRISIHKPVRTTLLLSNEGATLPYLRIPPLPSSMLRAVEKTPPSSVPTSARSFHSPDTALEPCQPRSKGHLERKNGILSNTLPQLPASALFDAFTFPGPTTESSVRSPCKQNKPPPAAATTDLSRFNREKTDSLSVDTLLTQSTDVPSGPYSAPTHRQTISIGSTEPGVQLPFSWVGRTMAEVKERCSVDETRRIIVESMKRMSLDKPVLVIEDASEMDAELRTRQKDVLVLRGLSSELCLQMVS